MTAPAERTASIAHSNDVAGGWRLPQSARRSGRFWPFAIVGLLLMNASIVAFTIFVASNDASVAAEPEYYKKAVAFDETMRQRDASAKLGWSASAELLAPTSDATARVLVRINDRGGAPIDNADVDVVAFPVLRSAQRQALTLGRQEPGVYAAPITLEVAGKWMIRVRAARAGDVFTTETSAFNPAAMTAH